MNAYIIDGLGWEVSSQLFVSGIVSVLHLSVSYRNCRFHVDVVANVECIQKVIGDDNAAEHALIVAELGILCQQIDETTSIQYAVPGSCQSHTRP